MANTTGGESPHDRFNRIRHERIMYWATVHGSAIAFYESTRDRDVDVAHLDQDQLMVWEAMSILHSLAHEHCAQMQHELVCDVEVVSPAQFRRKLRAITEKPL